MPVGWFRLDIGEGWLPGSFRGASEYIAEGLLESGSPSPPQLGANSSWFISDPIHLHAKVCNIVRCLSTETAMASSAEI